MSSATLSSSSEEDHPGEVPVFERPALLVRVLDATEEGIRTRMARVRLIDRIFLLERDWLTRITMLMVILSLFWGAFGAFDAFGFQTQATAWGLGQPLHLSNQEAYSSLTLHGIRMLFGFAQQLEFALFGLLALNAIGVAARHKWVLYGSVLCTNLALLLMEGPVYLFPTFNDNYFPALGWYYLAPLGIGGSSAYAASPLWYLGWLLLGVGAILWSAWLLTHLVRWIRESSARGETRQLPAFLLFIVATAILVPLSYAAVIGSTLWDLGAYLGGWPLDSLVNQVMFWVFGHGIVYILFLLPVVALYLLVPILARRPVYSYRAALASAVLFVVLTPVLGIHHLYLTPVPPWSAWITMVFTFLIILPSAITFFSVWMTVKGVRADEWEWNTVSLFVLLAFAGSIAGGLTGPDNNTSTLDVDLHNTLFIVSHFHALTVLSITAGGMALAYALLPILIGRYWFSPFLSRLHFAMTALGGSGLVLFMDELGNAGILRREVIFPAVGAIPFYQVGLLGSIVVILVGQLFFVLNGFLSVFRGRPLEMADRSFAEVVRAAAQSTYPRPTLPVKEIPRPRRVSRLQRERAERIWVGVVVVLIVLVIALTTPGTLSTANDTVDGVAAPAGAVNVTLVGHQYYWSVDESGPVNGSFNNVLVATAGEWISVTATAVGASQSLYLPFRDQPTVNVEVVPGSVSHDLFQAPSVPGVYGAPDGEYDGPWFGQDVAALVVLPAGGGPANLTAFEANSGGGDVYNPPVRPLQGAALVADDEGLFDDSVPGPTMSAAPGAAQFTWTVPNSSIGIQSYLVNVTTSDPGGQAAWLASHNETVPATFGIYRIVPSTGLVPLSLGPLRIGQIVSEAPILSAGVYLYGVVSPIAYSYDPNGESGPTTGMQTGSVMGLWGVLWVSP